MNQHRLKEIMTATDGSFFPKTMHHWQCGLCNFFRAAEPGALNRLRKAVLNHRCVLLWKSWSA